MAPRIHHLLRLCALVVLATSVTIMAQRSNARVDMTAEGLSRITPLTEQLIASVGTEVDGPDGDKITIPPVVVTAYVSKQVPRAYVPLRSRLLNLLREMQASGGPGSDFLAEWGFLLIISSNELDIYREYDVEWTYND